MGRRAYRVDLWAAAYMIMGGCSDDGFMDFRDWLLLQGREKFETAIVDPDSLAEWRWEDEDRDYPSCESLLYECRVELCERDQRLPAADSWPELDFWDFEDDAERARRLPRLFNLITEGKRSGTWKF